ncbi:MAG: radical SAM protein [Spirochaetales bacterium]|nr:radical SAM protein [Spirochaetales bacterium]MCF7938489.1 radical SAM protein [Spirochaetales bacterium]
MAASENTFLKNLVLNKVSKSLTGKEKDLRKLVEVPKKSKLKPDPSVKHFIDGLEYSLDNHTPFSKIFLRVGTETSKAYKKKLVQNLIFNQFMYGRTFRETLYDGDEIVPNFIVISPTMRCNLRCTGCYSGLYTKDGELGEEDIDRILGEARDMGIYFVVISGGEPYIMKETLFKMFKKYNDMYFLTFTNGTFLNDDVAKKLAGFGNVSPAISVEGWEEDTDKRRGKGIWKRIMSAMDNLKRYGVLFGISVTATKYNQDVILDDNFVKFFVDKGAIFGWYFMFMPVGKDPILDLVPTPEQRVHMGKRVAELRDTYPIFLADFWNDGDQVGGCLAGGRQYLHILNSGKVEPCVFAHFGVDSIHEKPLREIVNSPFFKEIRASFPYNETANLKRPCMIIDNPEVLRNAVDKHLVGGAGHEHSEDIIHDPEVVKWVDNYAAEFKALTEADWEKRINDPNDMWYKEGDDYKRLFAHRKKYKGTKEYEEAHKNDSQENSEESGDSNEKKPLSVGS